MPAGLDGYPDPIRTPARDAVLATVADRIGEVGRSRVVVGVDGRSGVGKSTFADEVATRLAERGLVAIRSTTDSFHRPREERLARGATSPAGYYLDSHDLDRMVTDLLEPFRSGAGEVLVAAFDEPTDAPAERSVDVPAEAVLVIDGLFLHRPEFVERWDLSVLLEAGRRLDAAWLDYLLGDLPEAPSARAAELDRRLDVARWPRYRRGWDRYVERVVPRGRASMIVDNDDLAHPQIVDPS